MESSENLSGPNLKAGIPVSTFATTKKILGHVDNEPVLLVCDNNQYFAIAPFCTHYHGPLEEGLCANGTIRCPWHHACFDLNTGEAVKAPAFAPLTVWRTEVVGDVVFVREKITAPRQPEETKGNGRFVIVGGGAAGYAAGEMLRRQGFEGAITMISADASVPYDRPNLSKDFLAGTAPEEWIPLQPLEAYAQAKIDLLLNTTVTKLDPIEKTLSLHDGRQLHFDKCLLATGGTPKKPPLPGANLPNVFCLRTLADCQRLIAGAVSAKKVAIVGAGFIGLEAACAFKARGLEVTIIAPDQLPLARILGTEAGELIQQVHVANGIQFQLNSAVREIRPNSVVTAEGQEIEADLVLLATGISPNTQLAEDAGIKCDDGVLVDSFLSTSAPDIFAAGDIARWQDEKSGQRLRIEHWVVAQRQGQIAAMNMLGEPTPYRDVPVFWSQQFDLVLNFVGQAANWTQTKCFGDFKGRNGIVAYYTGSRVTGILAVGRDQEALLAEKAFEDDDAEAVESLLRTSFGG